MENRTLFCSTKRFEGDDAVQTKLTLDFSNVSESELIEYAIDALVIKWQSAARRAGNKKDNAVPIPKVATYVVPKPGTRATGAISDRDALVRVVGESAATMLIEAAGGDAKRAFEEIKKQLGIA